MQALLQPQNAMKLITNDVDCKIVIEQKDRLLTESEKTLHRLKNKLDQVSVNSSTQQQIEAFCCEAIQSLQTILIQERDPLVVEQAQKLEKIVREILLGAADIKSSKMQLRIIDLTTKIKRNIKGQHLIMKVKGKKMQLQQDFDHVYHYFCSQIKNHHNSEPFKVKGIGEAAL